MMPSEVRGYVLAGGESSRMQTEGLPVDKASLVWRGQSLLERASTLLSLVCETHGILCGTKERCSRLQLGLKGIVDRFAGVGPLGGFEAALADAKEHGVCRALIVPVDLPNLTSDLLCAFVSFALASGASACCLRSNGVTQPLPAAVHVDALPVVQELLLSGTRRLMPALDHVARQLTPEQGLTLVEVDDLRCVGDSSRWFQNVNTPAEFRLLQEDDVPETTLHQSTDGR